MKFYDNRFDFLRFVDTSINFNEGFDDWNSATPEEIEELYNYSKDYILPVEKFQLENGKEIGENNIVTGSTCFFVNTGDLFVARRYRLEGYSDDNFEWYKVGEEEIGGGYTSYHNGDNPYYEEEGPGPV